MGHKVCTYYDKIARANMKRYNSQIPDIELSYLAEGTPEYGDYLTEMKWCVSFADANHAEMVRSVEAAFAELGFPILQKEYVRTHHNYVAIENHNGQNVWVHRKGAVKATGLVTIPGSMGTASYIGRGLTPKESFNTCSHGAGRVMSRRKAKETISHERALESMQHVVFGTREGAYDEHPDAYKSIDAVMEAQQDLVEPVYRLLPLAVVKG